MIIEKLLLHVLIVLSPVLIFSVITNGKRDVPNALLGSFYALAAVLCMVFSFQTDGLHWDLRYVVIISAFLYGGRKIGWMVFGVVMITRTLFGGDNLLFAYTCIVSAALISHFFYAKYYQLISKWHRTIVTIAMSLVPVFYQVSIVVASFYYGSLPLLNESVYAWYLVYYVLVIIVAAGFITLLHEAINEKHHMQEEIIRAEKFNTLAGLAASIAHEVRNPLTVVKGFLQLMKEDKKHSNEQYFSLVLDELGRAEGIINDYLNFAKPELKSIDDVDLLANVKEIYALLKPYALKDGVNLNVLIETDEHLIVRADRNQLKQALINFVKNAIEATPSGGNVSIILDHTDHLVTVHVSDTGKGMNKEQLNRIGTLFYTTKDKGTGLGTMVSMRIIEALGGEVSFQSKEYVGTTVAITLPIKDRDGTRQPECKREKQMKVI
ncbi:ATP-binding protein [Bacillus sp. FJAT-45037]|uniref:ATP-binding protein n=1 Tax=Bacillus sp. FJAT-45037 TaxID=2011007 RepID=UPI000C24F4FE|nr:ATP-binding protein [Bacillus sp. FJAT-45037]